MIINKSDKYDAPPKHLVLLNHTHLNAPNQVPQVSSKAKKTWKTLYVVPYNTMRTLLQVQTIDCRNHLFIRGHRYFFY